MYHLQRVCSRQRASSQSQPTVIADDPQVRAPFTLTAAYDGEEGHNVFFFGGKVVPPVIRVLPGGSINVGYVNELPPHSNEQCALDRCAETLSLASSFTQMCGHRHCLRAG